MRAVNALRQLTAHRRDSSSKDKLKKSMEQFGVDDQEVAAGFGAALDAVYDQLAEEMEEAVVLLQSISF